MFCSNCGVEMSENAKFCSNCGAEIAIGDDILSDDCSYFICPECNEKVEIDFDCDCDEDCCCDCDCDKE